MTQGQRNEIKALIRFYERRGKDWGPALTFTAARFEGIWPPPRPYWNKRGTGGRPRKLKRRKGEWPEPRA